MDISQLAAKPQLIEVRLEDAPLVEKYGEPIVFWIYDRQPLDVYAKLATASGENADIESIIKVVEKMILDKDGNVVITPERSLPIDVLMAAVTEIGATMGK